MFFVKNEMKNLKNISHHYKMILKIKYFNYKAGKDVEGKRKNFY